MKKWTMALVVVFFLVIASSAQALVTYVERFDLGTAFTPHGERYQEYSGWVEGLLEHRQQFPGVLEIRVYHRALAPTMAMMFTIFESLDDWMHFQNDPQAQEQMLVAMTYWEDLTREVWGPAIYAPEPFRLLPEVGTVLHLNRGEIRSDVASGQPGEPDYQVGSGEAISSLVALPGVHEFWFQLPMAGSGHYMVATSFGTMSDFMNVLQSEWFMDYQDHIGLYHRNVSYELWLLDERLSR